MIQPIERIRANRRSSLVLLLLLLLLIGGCSASVLVGAGSHPPGASVPLITSTPSDPTSATSATFHYTDSSPRATFRCSLDGSHFQSCPAGGVTYSNLTVGTHQFRVEATVGRSVSPAATFHWTVISTTPYQPVRIPGGTVALPPTQSSATPSPVSTPSSQPPSTTLPTTNSITSTTPTTAATTSPTTATATSPTTSAATGTGSSPSVSGNLTSLLYPGETQLLDLVFTNPNPVPVAIAPNGVDITLSTDQPGCPATPNFSVSRGLTTGVTIPAGSTESLSQLGVPTSDWPVIEMVDTHSNQDACEGATLDLAYSVTVTG